jgi:1-acyl-sn-glycerol-3-phosphate acyltransferase
LGDPDVIVLLAALPEFPEIVGKSELQKYPLLRCLGKLLGVIWIHPGEPDRRAISATLGALRKGRRVLLAPEGKEAESGGLEKGKEGAAFIALMTGVQIVPVTITGTEFRKVENNIGIFKRTAVCVTVGKPFSLPFQSHRSERLHISTRIIMETLARYLPPEYRGVYTYIEEPMEIDQV